MSKAQVIVFLLQIILFAVLAATGFQKPNRSALVEKTGDKVFVPLLLALSLTVPFAYIHAGHDWGGDFSEYIAQAQSILSGTMKEQAQVNDFMMTNSSVVIGPSTYPWGFPLMLAPVIRLFGVNFFALKSVAVLFFAGSMLLLYHILKEKTQLTTARIGVLVFLFNPALLLYCNMVLPDIPFMFFSLLTVYCIDRLFHSETRQWGYALTLGVSCVISYFLRSNGVVALLALLFCELTAAVLSLPALQKIKRRFHFSKQKLLPHLTVYALFAAGFAADRLWLPTGSTGYHSQFKDFSLQMIENNAALYVNDICNFFCFGIQPLFPVAFVMAVLFVCSAVCCFFGEYVALVYAAGTVATMILFPGYQGVRYLLPALPWMFMLCLQALECIERRVRASSHEGSLFLSVKKALVCVLLLSMVFGTVSTAVHYDKNATNHSYSAEALEVYDYISENTEEDDMIAFFKPRVLWLNTHRKGFYVDETNMERLSEFDYALVSMDDYSDEVRQQCEKNYPVAFENGAFILFEIKH